MAERAALLSIVIPALDEEAAIGDTVRRCLEARPQLVSEAGLRDVEILVVSDGSTDRTEEIARGFPAVTVLGFDRNRGYGAAIKCGFEHARGDLLGFLDADGTCDPLAFAPLCRALEREAADLALGSRLGAGSRMPPLRALGNLVFAWILGLLSRQSVGDTASGMRVMRRSALPDLYPLPDGLHFTPAMSARVLLEGKLRMVEVPMSYAERVGRSKLSVLRDGVRFLRSIVSAAMCYRPARPLLLIASVVALGAFAVGVGPSVYYARHLHLEEWMIYRILFASLLATMAAILASTAVVAERIAAAAHGRPASTQGVTARLTRLFTPRMRALGGAVLVVAALLLTAPGIAQYAAEGQVDMHWSRAVLASLLLVLAVALASATFLLDLIELIRVQRAGGSGVRPPDRLRPARSEGAAAPRAHVAD